MDDLAEPAHENPIHTPIPKIIPYRLVTVRYRPRFGRHPSGGYRRDHCSRDRRQDHSGITQHCSSPKNGWHLRIYRLQTVPSIQLYAQHCGVRLEQLYFSQPEGEEQALDIAERLVETGAISILVLDSLTSLVPYRNLTRPFDELDETNYQRFSRH